MGDDINSLCAYLRSMEWGYFVDDMGDFFAYAIVDGDVTSVRISIDPIDGELDLEIVRDLSFDDIDVETVTVLVSLSLFPIDPGYPEFKEIWYVQRRLFLREETGAFHIKLRDL